MRSPLPLVLLVVAFLLAGCRQDDGHPECRVVEDESIRLWSVFLGNEQSSPAFPDPSANYRIYAFDRKNLADLGIRLRGYFPAARYWSISVYDMQSRNALATLLDVDVKPCGAAGNPFTGEADPGMPSSYVLDVLPEGTPAAPTASNVLRYDAGTGAMAIVLRYYLPEGDATGGVHAPVVEAFDLRSDVPEKLPRPLPADVALSLPELRALVAPIFFLEGDSDIEFYNVGSDGLYATPDNHYLAAPVTRRADEVFVLRFRAPSFPKSPAGNATAQTRYWSLTQGDEDTFAYGGLVDEQAVVDPDGYVTVVFADLDDEIVRRGQGMNLVQWRVPAGRRAVLIYRNLVTRPGFAGDIARVPRIDTTNFLGWRNLRAQLFIHDYAPIGRRMTRREFLAGFGGSAGAIVLGR